MTPIRPLAARIVRGIALVILAASVAASPMLGSAAAAVSERTVVALAGEIIRGLERADVDALPAGSGYGQPTIAIKAYTDDSGPADIADIDYASDRLLMALQHQARGRFRFVARDAVGDLMADIDATTAPSAEREARLRDLQANMRADILIRAVVRRTERGPVLSYQALASETGQLFVTTTPVYLAAPTLAQASADASPPPAASIEPALLGSRPTVLEAERLLAGLGYDPGLVDGVLTDQTRAALRAYQRDSALPVNGRMTRHVVENMRRDTR